MHDIFFAFANLCYAFAFRQIFGDQSRLIFFLPLLKPKHDQCGGAEGEGGAGEPA